MSIADMGNFQYDTPVDPSNLSNPDDPAVQGSSFDGLYPFDISGDDFADAPQADAPFDLADFNFDQPSLQVVDSGIPKPAAPQSLLPDERYVPFPSQSQTHSTSVWYPIEQPSQQSQYPDPGLFSHPPIAPTPYYPLQPLALVNPTTQHNFQAITPPSQQPSSIDCPLFLHDNMGPPIATAGSYPYQPIQTYQDNGAFNPEDLAFSESSDDLIATAIREGWPVTGNKKPQKRPHPNDLYIPDTSNDSDVAIFHAPNNDPDYKLSSSSRAKRTRRSNRARPQAILPNGQVKKGRPCDKPQTEERRRVNQRRMEGYYRRKYDQGNLEKARLQSKESYWRRKQRRIEAGEKVRSYKKA